MPPKTEKFLRGVRRRVALVRLAESIGIGCIVAAGLGAILVAALWWRGQSGVEAAIGMLCLGILAGSIWGLMRFPTTFAAASEADRQLGLSDLLGTILLAGPSDDPWHRAIAAMAEERCSRLHPRDLIVAKLGFRAWSGVGLSAALLMTLSLLSAHPSDLRADATDAIDAPPDAVALADPQISSDALRLAPFQDSRPGGKGVDANSDRSFEEDQQADGAANAAGTENHAGMNGASDSGNGEGLSVTKGSFSSQDP